MGEKVRFCDVAYLRSITRLQDVQRAIHGQVRICDATHQIRLWHEYAELAHSIASMGAP